MHHTHGLMRLVFTGLVLVVAVMFIVLHPVHAIMLVYRVAATFVTMADNLATGRFQ